MTFRLDFHQSAEHTAPLLLGGVLRFGQVAVRLTEVEAYVGRKDPASHAYNGPTPRCETMFGPPQRLYVYASYGIHRAGNLVCHPEGEAGGILLRAGEVIAGRELVRQRRGEKHAEENLARGPGNLGQALGFDLHLDGSRVIQVDDALGVDNPEEGVLYLQPPAERAEFVAGPRIGISKNVDAPLRFWIPGDRTVSSPRSRPRAI